MLDRIVPGYYHRLDEKGHIEKSTCCENTDTEHLMMGKLMSDSVLLWAREYKIASFRFDIMGHQPRSVMEAIKARLKTELGREVQLLGEGWNFGEVMDGRRFVQASMWSLNGSGIGTFSPFTRDAIRGGKCAAQDKADGDKAYAASRWDEADRFYQQVVANKYARATDRRTVVDESAEFAHPARPGGLQDG